MAELMTSAVQPADAEKSARDFAALACAQAAEAIKLIAQAQAYEQSATVMRKLDEASRMLDAAQCSVQAVKNLLTSHKTDE